MRLNNHRNFDKSKPFLQTLLEDGVTNRFLSDSTFSEACNVFGITEDEAIEAMLYSEYTFNREENGWIVTTIDGE